MMKRLAAAFMAAALLLAPSAAVSQSAGTSCVEAQSWWDGAVGGGEPEHIGFPFRHIHFEVCIPNGPVSGIVEVPFKAQTHSNVGKLLQVKWQDDKGGSAQTIIIKPNRVLGPDDEYSGMFRIDTSKEVNSGLRQWRFYAVWEHLNGNRHVARPVFLVDVRNGKPLKNMGTNTEFPTGWYKESNGFDWGYVRAGISYEDRLALGTPKCGTWSPVINGSVNGQEESPAVDAIKIHLDPDFHDGESGTLLASLPGEHKGKVNLDLTGVADGEHVLVIRTIQQDGDEEHNAVGRYRFIVDC